MRVQFGMWMMLLGVIAAVTLAGCPCPTPCEGDCEGEGEGMVEGEGMTEGEGECPTTSSATSSGTATTLTMTRTAEDCSEYVPGTQFTMQLRLTKNGGATVTSLGIEEMLPPGWNVADNGSGGPNVTVTPSDPAAQVSFDEGTNTMNIFWIVIPSFPIQITYVLDVPNDAMGTNLVTGETIFRFDGGELRTPTVTTELTEVI